MHLRQRRHYHFAVQSRTPNRSSHLGAYEHHPPFDGAVTKPDDLGSRLFPALHSRTNDEPIHSCLIFSNPQLETALMKIIGVKPRYFRPPYGAWNAAAVSTIQAMGYQGTSSPLLLFPNITDPLSTQSQPGTSIPVIPTASPPRPPSHHTKPSTPNTPPHSTP